MNEASAHVVLDVLGTRVRVQGHTEMIARVRDQWARCRTLSAPTVTIDLLAQLEANQREYQLASGLNLLGIQHASHRLNLHAAGLADSSGAVAALVAPSGTGKTTAATVLGRSLGYVTDECVSIDPTTRTVLPYPKPLSLVIDPAFPQVKTQVGPDELGLSRAPDALTLGAIHLLARADGVPASLEPAPLLDAVQALMTQVSGLGALESPMRQLTDLVNAVGGASWLRYSEIADAEPLVRGALTEPLRGVEAYEHVPGPMDGDLRAGEVGATHDEAIRSGSDALLLADGALVRLSGVAMRLWAAAARSPMSAERLADETQDGGVTDEELGDLLTQLMDAGVLRRF